MPSRLQMFDTILDNSFKESPSGSSYTLKEPKEGTSFDTKLKTKGQIAVYSFDKDGVRLLPFFSNGTDVINKCCDYIFLYPQPSKNTFWVFICELKAKADKAFTQLFMSRTFVDYIEAARKSYCHLKKLSITDENLNIELRALIIAKKAKRFSTNPRTDKYSTIGTIKPMKYKVLRATKDILLELHCI